MPRWHFSSRFVVDSVAAVPPHPFLRPGLGTGIMRSTTLPPLPPVRRAACRPVLPAAVLRVGTIVETDVLQIVVPGVPRVNQRVRHSPEHRRATRISTTATGAVATATSTPKATTTIHVHDPTQAMRIRVLVAGADGIPVTIQTTSDDQPASLNSTKSQKQEICSDGDWMTAIIRRPTMTRWEVRLTDLTAAILSVTALKIGGSLK